MRYADRLREEQQKAADARPIILEGLRRGDDPVLIGEVVAARFEVDEKLAYRWVVYSEEHFDRSRRGIAAAGASLMWVGGLVVISGLVLRLFGSGLVGRPFMLGTVIGVPLLVTGLVLGLFATRLAR